MPAYDFYSPFLSAAIITKAGERVPLWTNVLSKGEPNKYAEKFTQELTQGLVSFPFLESLTIELQLGLYPRMVAVLTPPWQNARQFLDSILVENGKSILEAVIGYSAGTGGGVVLSSPFQAMILEPEISLGTETVITLNALGVAGYDCSANQASRSFSGKTRKHILEEVAKGPDIASSVGTDSVGDDIITEASLARALENKSKRQLTLDYSEITAGTEADIALSETKVTMSQGWKTDWMFMLQVAQEAGCWLLQTGQDGTVIKVISIQEHLAEDPSYTLRYYDYIGGKLGPDHANTAGETANGTLAGATDGDFPILSVSSLSKQVWQPGATKALVATGIDSSTGEAVRTVTTDGNAGPAKVTGGGGGTVKPDGSNSGLDPKTGAGGAPSNREPEFGDGKAVERANFAASFSMGIQLKVTTLGIPNILPGHVVAVRGLGLRFDFNYGVFVVKHHIGVSGFTTELELISNTAAELASLNKAKGEKNKDKPKDKKIEVTPKAEPVVGQSPGGGTSRLPQQ